MKRESKKKLEKKNKKNGLIVLPLFLFVCVAATGILLAGRLKEYVFAENNVIELIPLEAETVGASLGDSPDKTQENLVSPAEAVSENSADEIKKSAPEKIYSAPQTENSQGTVFDYQVEDDKLVWSADTEVEIFRVAYENGQGMITVNGANGDKLIAPGTENEYSFRLKNSGSTKVDYTLGVEAYMTPGNAPIPIEVRLKNHDGVYLVGNENQWAGISELNRTTVNESVESKNSEQYILEWQWPFETTPENNIADTALGNETGEQRLTIIIRTVASAEPSVEPGGETAPGGSTTNGGTTGETEPEENHGIWDILANVPKTGDSANIMVYMILLVAAGAFLLILFFRRRNKEEADEKTQKDSET